MTPTRISELPEGLRQLAELRRSGSIEQDANGVIFIYRPDIHNQLYYPLDGEDVSCDKTDAIVSIGKWRLGAIGDFRMKFRGQWSRFEDTREVSEPLPDFGSGIIGFRNDLEEIPF